MTDKATRKLVELLTLQQIGALRYTGESADIGSRSVYGGQVLGQALMAARETVENRNPHSLHGYFLRAGDYRQPIEYMVFKDRDGRSFSNRRVLAIQEGKTIFHLSASFQVDQPDRNYQTKMPDVIPPEQASDQKDFRSAWLNRLPEERRESVAANWPIEFRPIEAPPYAPNASTSPQRHIWFKAAQALDVDRKMQEAILAYASDYGLLMTALYPLKLNPFETGVRMASLDHAMWFHRTFDMNDWLLYQLCCSNVGGGRALTRGSIYDQQGNLVASTAQEGMLRTRVAQS